MLSECESTIKEETQVLPCGAWVKGGSPSVGGIAKIDVRVTVTVFLGEVESFQLAVFEDQAHGLSQLKHNFVSRLKLNKIKSHPLTNQPPCPPQRSPMQLP
jgi:hypothetical protein